jgi:CRISPR/Cas system-associated protein Cas10 (large subunit of type III CRISPR-Cas system)
MSREKYDRQWNRCDVCGKFISFADFESGKALRIMVTPDSDYTAETFETLCRDHNDRDPRNRNHV